MTPSSPAMRSASAWACSASIGVQVGRGRDDLDADPVALHCLDDRPHRALPERRTRDVGRQLAPDLDVLLGDERRAGGKDVTRLDGVVDDPHAPAVVTAAGRLEDDGPPDLIRECLEPGRVGHRRPVRARDAELGQPLPHRLLVLREAQRLRAGMDRDAVRGQRGNVLGRHVFVVEGDDVAPPREGAQIVQRPEVADHDVGRDERRAVVRRVGEDAQRLAERDGRLVGHPRQLAGAHHADDGQPGALVHDQASLRSFDRQSLHRLFAR